MKTPNELVNESIAWLKTLPVASERCSQCACEGYQAGFRAREEEVLNLQKLVHFNAKQAAKLSRDLAEAERAAQPKWISVKERLPEFKIDVLVKCSKLSHLELPTIRKTLAYDFYSVMSLYCETENGNETYVWDTRPETDVCPLNFWEVTHWMPLPPAPEEEK